MCLHTRTLAYKEMFTRACDSLCVCVNGFFTLAPTTRHSLRAHFPRRHLMNKTPEPQHTHTHTRSHFDCTPTPLAPPASWYAEAAPNQRPHRRAHTRTHRTLKSATSKMAMRQKPSARYLISNKATAAVENNARDKNKTHKPPCHRCPSTTALAGSNATSGRTRPQTRPEKMSQCAIVSGFLRSARPILINQPVVARRRTSQVELLLLLLLSCLHNCSCWYFCCAMLCAFYLIKRMHTHTRYANPRRTKVQRARANNWRTHTLPIHRRARPAVAAASLTNCTLPTPI